MSKMKIAISYTQQDKRLNNLKTATETTQNETLREKRQKKK